MFVIVLQHCLQHCRALLSCACMVLGLWVNSADRQASCIKHSHALCAHACMRRERHSKGGWGVGVSKENPVLRGCEALLGVALLAVAGLQEAGLHAAFHPAIGCCCHQGLRESVYCGRLYASVFGVAASKTSVCNGVFLPCWVSWPARPELKAPAAAPVLYVSLVTVLVQVHHSRMLLQGAFVVEGCRMHVRLCVRALGWSAHWLGPSWSVCHGGGSPRAVPAAVVCMPRAIPSVPAPGCWAAQPGCRAATQQVGCTWAA